MTTSTMRTALVFGCGVLCALLLSHTNPPAARAAPSNTQLAELIARTDPLIAHVTTRLKDEGTRRSKDDGVGAGFVVNDGLIVTSRHVVSGARQVVVTFPGQAPQIAEIVGVDDATDTAVLRVPNMRATGLHQRDPRTLRKGERVYAVGSPFHLANSWSEGIVSGLGRTGLGVNPRGYEHYIQSDAAANLGNSGGPLLDESGAVVGVVSAILTRNGGSQGITLAVPIDAVQQAVDRIRGVAPKRKSLGLSVRPNSAGVLQVTRVAPGSLAARAGLRVGALVWKANETRLTSAADLQRVFWRLPSNGRLVLTVSAGAGAGQRLLPVPLR